MLRDQDWLEEALHALDLVCFDGHVPPLAVKWHRYRRAERPTLGDYLDGRIRLNRILQSETIPTYYVLSTLYHECLHALLGHEHNPLFLVTERQSIPGIQRLCSGSAITLSSGGVYYDSDRAT
jgi:hypothetical protein